MAGNEDGKKEREATGGQPTVEPTPPSVPPASTASEEPVQPIAKAAHLADEPMTHSEPEIAGGIDGSAPDLAVAEAATPTQQEIRTTDTMVAVPLPSREEPVNSASSTAEQTETTPATPNPMPPKARQLLLAEAKERYKAELDRYGQAFTRSGIYMAVVAVYVNALVRYADKPPDHTNRIAFGVFLLGAVILVAATGACVFCIYFALVGREMGYAVRPSVWKTYVDKELQAYFEKFFPGAVDERLEAELQTRMLTEYCGAIDLNVLQNRRRFRLLFISSVAVLVGLVGLGTSVGSYLVLLRSAPPPAASMVKVVDPVVVRVHDVAKQEEEMSNRKQPTQPQSVPATTSVSTATPAPPPPPQAQVPPPPPGPKFEIRRDTGDGGLRK